MNSVYLYLLALGLIFETGVLLLLVRRIVRLEQRSLGLEARLDELGQAVARLDDDGGALFPETPTEDRKKAREAERRFTEGVASILGFSGAGGGRKGEGA